MRVNVIVLLEIGMIYMIKQGLLLTTILMISSCSQFSFYSDVYNAVKVSVIGANDAPISYSYFEDQPYSFLKVRFGRSAPVIMVLVSYNEGLAHWVSADKISIHTFKGKIVMTSGLLHDVHTLNPRVFSLQDKEKINFTVDFIEPAYYSGRFISSIKKEEDLTRDYLGQPTRLSLYKESVKSDAIRFKSLNEYWVNENGKIIISTQKIHPFLPSIELEFYFK